MNVLVDISDVDNVLARAGSPMQLHLPSGFGIVFEDLERALVPILLVDNLDHLAVDAQAEDILADRVVLRDRVGLGGKVAPGLAYNREQELVNGLQSCGRGRRG